MSNFNHFRACADISRQKMKLSKKRVTWTDETPHGGALTTVREFYTSQTELEERNAVWGQIESRARGELVSQEHPEDVPSNPEEPPVKPTKRPTKLRRSKRIAAALKRKKAREAPPTRRSARIAARNASSV